MPTSATTPARKTKAGRKSNRKAKPAAKPTARKASATRRTKTTARKATATRRARAGSTRAKVSQARASRTRAAHQTQAALGQTQQASRDTVEVFGDYAERAVLIPVGAALIARERVVSTVSDTFSSYSSPSRAQAQLRRFERRGLTARKRLEREVRKARVRVEREVRLRRRDIERSVTDLEARRESVAKNSGDLANRVQERLLSIV